MTLAQTTGWLHGFLAQRSVSSAANGTIDPHVDIVEAGILDSFGIVELIVEIEATFQIGLTAEDIEDPRFRTVAGLADLIQSHVSSGA